MRALSNERKVSRERIIGLSLVDILLQAVFLLFVALVIGYEDPQIRLLQSEYQIAGRDLCQKDGPGRDSVTKCVEDLKRAKEFRNKHSGANAANLFACMPKDKTSTKPAASFSLLTSSSFRFNEFTSDYYAYLTERSDTQRLAAAKSVRPGTVLSSAEIEKVFYFVREAECYHDTSSSPAPTMSAQESDKARGVLRATFKRLSN